MKRSEDDDTRPHSAPLSGIHPNLSQHSLSESQLLARQFARDGLSLPSLSALLQEDELRLRQIQLASLHAPFGRLAYPVVTGGYNLPSFYGASTSGALGLLGGHHALVGGLPSSGSAAQLLSSPPQGQLLQTLDLPPPAAEPPTVAQSTASTSQKKKKNPTRKPRRHHLPSSAEDESTSPIDRKLPPPQAGKKLSTPAVDYRYTPCKARGMPANHNSKTAVLKIPNNVQHGDFLSCSEKRCREEGPKFRFCVVCGVPVAQRNFTTRHHHGLDLRSGREDTESSSLPPAEEQGRGHGQEVGGAAGSSSKESTAVGDVAAAAVALIQPEENEKDSLKRDKDDVNQTLENQGSEKETREPKKRTLEECEVTKSCSSSAPRTTLAPPVAASSQPELCTQNEPEVDGSGSYKGSKRRKIQADGSEIVMVDFTFSAAVTARTTPECRSEWAQLLARRPADDKSDAFQAWVKEVISVSNPVQPSSSDASDGEQRRAR